MDLLIILKQILIDGDSLNQLESKTIKSAVPGQDVQAEIVSESITSHDIFKLHPAGAEGVSRREIPD